VKIHIQGNKGDVTLNAANKSHGTNLDGAIHCIQILYSLVDTFFTRNICNNTYERLIDAVKEKQSGHQFHTGKETAKSRT